MSLQDTNAALDTAIAAMCDAAADVLRDVIDQVAQARPGATLRVSPDTYELTSVELHVVGGGPVSALHELVDIDTLRVAERAALAKLGVVDTGQRAGHGPDRQPDPLIITPRTR
jgi:hypothetical protein